MKNEQLEHAADVWDVTEHVATPQPQAALAEPVRAPTQATAARPQAQEKAHATTESADVPAPGDARPVPHKNKLNNFPAFTARSAMFRASTSREPYEWGTPVKAAGCSLTLTGPRLGMRDKHVWETAIQVAKERSKGIGEAYEIELRDFARRMGCKSFNGPALKSIWASLERIAQVRVEFEIHCSCKGACKSQCKGYSCKGVGSLLSTASKTEESIYLRLNPDFAMPALVGDKQFRINQLRRASLPSALSQWLHDYFSTHSKSEPLDLFYLRELCGYDGCERNFPGKLDSAMKALVAGAPGVVASFGIKRPTRDSDSWVLEVVLGVEKPSFQKARPVPAHKTSKGAGRVNL